MAHVIDNKKIDLTPDEWTLYQKIVKSYTTPTNKGEDLFIDLFEVDEDGVIVFLRPPSKRQTSLEVFMFLVAIQSQQHIRIMYKRIDDVCEQVRNKLKEIKA